MSPPSRLRAPLAAAVAAASLFAAAAAPAQAVTGTEVKRAIDRGVDALEKQQNADGSWSFQSHSAGATALCTLALLNAGEAADAPAVAAGLAFLRNLRVAEISETYDAALVIMAFAAAKDGRRDQARMLELTRRLERGQRDRGRNAGGWDYKLGDGGDGRADNSISQYAILGLRDAAFAGIPVDRRTWRLAAEYWAGPNNINRDGSWGYTPVSGGGDRVDDGGGRRQLRDHSRVPPRGRTEPRRYPRLLRRRPPRPAGTGPRGRRGVAHPQLQRAAEPGRPRHRTPSLLPLRSGTGRPAQRPAVLRHARLVPRGRKVPRPQPGRPPRRLAVRRDRQQRPGDRDGVLAAVSVEGPLPGAAEQAEVRPRRRLEAALRGRPEPRQPRLRPAEVAEAGDVAGAGPRKKYGDERPRRGAPRPRDVDDRPRRPEPGRRGGRVPAKLRRRRRVPCWA